VTVTDPTFQTRADLEAWAKDLAGQATVAASLSAAKEPEEAKAIYASAINQLRRVMLAHVHLKDTDHGTD